jgi:hypothetical protein
MKNRKRNGSCRQVVFDGVLKTKRMCIFFLIKQAETLSGVSH